MNDPASTNRLLSMTLNEVIREDPEAVRVFGRLGMDACCGGSLTLEEACRRHGLDPGDVLRELEARPARS